MNKLHINYQNIVKNVALIEEHFHKKLFIAVKNDAYNYKVVDTVEVLANAGYFYYVTISIIDAIKIKKTYLDAYILILNPLNEEQIELAINNEIVMGITSYEWFIKHKDLLENGVFHLEINSGMNRFGINDISQINEILASNLNIEGLYTHFGASDEEDLSVHNQQVNTFLNIWDEINPVYKDNFKYIHSENSSTLILNDPRLAFCNYARVGTICYGYTPTTPIDYLLPTFYLFSKVISVTKRNKGDLIGYGTSNILEADSYVGIASIGYGDGLLKLRSKLPICINNKLYKIITISMSHLLFIADEDVNVNDVVEIYGNIIRPDHLLKYVDTGVVSENMSALKHG